MPFEPVFRSTQEITTRLRAMDAAHPFINRERLEGLTPEGTDFDEVRKQIGDAIEHTVDQLPENPTLDDANKALGSLVRNVDHGGRLHATLAHAMGITPGLTESRPLPAIPPAPFHPDLFTALMTRRTAAVIGATHDAVESAIAEFRQGVASQPLHIDEDPARDPVFLGDLRARQDVYDVLERAQSHLGNLRTRLAVREEQLHDDSDIEITEAQKAILKESARGFVTDIVRNSQRLLRTASDEANRATIAHEHIDSAMQQIAHDKEPLRFATSWVTDANYPRAHQFIGELPSFRHDDLESLETHGSVVDHALIQILRERAFPKEAATFEIDEQLRGDPAINITRHPIFRAGMAAGTVLLHLNPHLYPIRAFRPIIASRKWLAGTLFLQSNLKTAKFYLMRMSKRQAGIAEPRLPERALLEALRNDAGATAEA